MHCPASLWLNRVISSGMISLWYFGYSHDRITQINHTPQTAANVIGFLARYTKDFAVVICYTWQARIFMGRVVSMRSLSDKGGWSLNTLRWVPRNNVEMNGETNFTRLSFGFHMLLCTYAPVQNTSLTNTHTNTTIFKKRINMGVLIFSYLCGIHILKQEQS